jgi:hypothetical protein
MAEHQRDARQLPIFAAVVVFHVAVVWLLLAMTQPVMRSPSPNLEWVFIAPTIVVPERPARKPVPRSQRFRRPKSTPSPAVEMNSGTPSEEGNSVSRRIDWVNELDRAARKAVAAPPAIQPRDFAFPHSSATPLIKASRICLVICAHASRGVPARRRIVGPHSVCMHPIDD